MNIVLCHLRVKRREGGANRIISQKKIFEEVPIIVHWPEYLGNYLFLKLFCPEEVGEKSSHYGLNMLGYTRATRLKTIRCNSVN